MIMSGHQGSSIDLSALVDRELSLAVRLGRLVLVLVLLVTTGTIGILGLTEPSLPWGARVAFSVILLLGLAGSAFALLTLNRRTTMLAWHRVVGCRVAVAFSAIVVLGAGTIGYMTGTRGAYAVAGLGVFLLCGSIALLRQAMGHYAALTARRRALEQQINTW